MNNPRSNGSRWRLAMGVFAIGAAGVLGAPSVHAIVSANLRVGLPERTFPATPFDSSLIGVASGSKELVMAGLPTTRAAAEGNLSSGVLRAVAQTDYFRAEGDSTGFSDSYTNAGVTTYIADTVTFSNVAVGQIGHLDMLVTGSFSTVPDARRIPWGTATATVGVSSLDRRVNEFRTRSFAADAESYLKLPPFAQDGASVGTSVGHFETVSFELLPGTYNFISQLSLSVGGYDADFGNTARLYLRLPEGVTYTSGSGVFLATATPLSPVPLPPTLHQALLGLGFMVAWFQRRRPTVTRHRVPAAPQRA